MRGGERERKRRKVSDEGAYAGAVVVLLVRAACALCRRRGVEVAGGVLPVKTKLTEIPPEK